MREHPIPQDITGYRFHIIGNMTLKQFGELALGIILAFIVYATNLPIIIKIPFIIIFALMGFVAAFIPIAERPLDHWIVTFFKVLYKPTQFFWKRDSHIPDVFTYKQRTPVVMETEIDMNPARRQRIREYLHSVDDIQDYQEEYEAQEIQRMQSILESFSNVPVKTANVDVVEATEKPQLAVRVRSMRPREQAQTVVNSVTENELSIDPTIPADQVYDQYDLQRLNPLTAGTNDQVLQTNQVAQNIEVPETQAMSVAEPELSDEETVVLNSTSQNGQPLAYIDNTVVQEQVVAPTQDAQFNQELPFPSMPDAPNKPVGMVRTETADLLVGAIVELHTQSGSIARAVKTNSLGQFFVTTPLSDGIYTVITEKDGYTFEPLELTLTGEIVQPIDIIGRVTS